LLTAFISAWLGSVLGKKPELRIVEREIVNPIGIKLVLIPAGEFLMGSLQDEDSALAKELPKHRVRITRPFYLGVTEVTQGQYRAVTGQSPGRFIESDNLPVEQVSWLDAVSFCNALSLREGLPPFYRVDGTNFSVPDWNGAGYRLPTEAEWEYACRANNPARYSFGDDPAGLGDHAWFDVNSREQTHRAGQKRANAFGLFDMYGNVSEWCFDGFRVDFYSRKQVDDPVCPFDDAPLRVNRGGNWGSNRRECRSASRYGFSPDFRDSGLGFRVARVPSGS
jgi:formylglycine-generating enzyme required for sulfatase activity